MTVRTVSTNCAQCGNVAELRITHYGPERLQAIAQLEDELAVERQRTPPNPQRVAWYEVTLGQVAAAELEARRNGDGRPTPPIMAIELIRCACGQPAAVGMAPAASPTLIEEAVALLRLLQPEHLVLLMLDGDDALPEMPQAFRAGIVELACRLKKLADHMPAKGPDTPPASEAAAPSAPADPAQPAPEPADQAAPAAPPALTVVPAPSEPVTETPPAPAETAPQS